MFLSGANALVENFLHMPPEIVFKPSAIAKKLLSFVKYIYFYPLKK